MSERLRPLIYYLFIMGIQIRSRRASRGCDNTCITNLISGLMSSIKRCLCRHSVCIQSAAPSPWLLWRFSEHIWPISFQKTNRHLKKTANKSSDAHQKTKRVIVLLAAFCSSFTSLSYHLQPPGALICDSKDIFFLDALWMIHECTRTVVWNGVQSCRSPAVADH